MKKRILSLLLALCLVCSLLPGVAYATTYYHRQNADGTYTLVECKRGSGVWILNVSGTYNGKSVTAIGDKVFYNFGTVERITLPNSIISIGDSAFESCFELKEINIPSNLTTIGNAAFQDCWLINNITLPNSLVTIGDSAFSSCHRLTSITIPDSVKTIGSYAFYNCNSLTEISIPQNTIVKEKALGYISVEHQAEKMTDFVINGYCGSDAQRYATENGFTFNATHDLETIPGTAPTCTTPGLSAGEQCKGCGTVITAQTEIPALGHDFNTSYLSDETGHWHKCSRCDAVDTKAAHTYNATNCDEATSCTICGYAKAAGTHIWNAGEVITAPTCTTTGTMKYTCTSCGTTKEEVIPTSAHTAANTWSSDGAGHWHNCTVCNEKVDSATHTFGSWKITTAATATTAGSKDRTCTVCGYKQTETIPATGSGSTGSSGIIINSGSSTTPSQKDDKKDEQQAENSPAYSDVPANTWYNEAIIFVTKKGLMSGTGPNTFSPDDILTRAMLAQILYNNEGRPSVTVTNIFTDVQNGAWYADAITWASQKGIVSGYGNGQFGPNDNITREQFVAILWRYAGQPTSSASFNSFTDIDKASDYALTALQWAVEKGIISGKGNGTLAPTGNATRAEVAQMLMNYFK